MGSSVRFASSSGHPLVPPLQMHHGDQPSQFDSDMSAIQFNGMDVSMGGETSNNSSARMSSVRTPGRNHNGQGGNNNNVQMSAVAPATLQRSDF